MSEPESLPDLSQADASHISSFSLSPGGTAPNTSCVLSPAMLSEARYDNQDNKCDHLSPAIGFRARGIKDNASSLRPDRPRAFC